MQECLAESKGNGVGRFVSLFSVEETNLAGYAVEDEGTNGCQVCFSAYEYAMGENACRLDGSLLRISEIFLPNSANRSMRSLHHQHHGFACAKIFNWSLKT